MEKIWKRLFRETEFHRSVRTVKVSRKVAGKGSVSLCPGAEIDLPLCAGVAQMVERLIRNQQVMSSSLIISSMEFL